ncbi:hypothetical protein BK131_00895 [Paenibacillus amylolyticus]|uniref:RiboL-PSP-HEPN domain-containing protein n=1 Tax=Paenibacillus amylolyticus TaxID=1451 RepID=A0A1R1C3H7_PAEAM|nr:hypothetical protein [Paenibacillus amylolyticus]OMF16587.1 hypothetical protein BK131_00895 [Paenibacillus amylolyticus]
MQKVKNYIKRKTTGISTYIILIILITLVMTLFGPLMILTENQILYVFSASAQVVAGLYGLTLTGYIFYHSKLEGRLDNDDTLEDQITEIKVQSYEAQYTVGILSGVFIFLSISIIFLYNQSFLLPSFVEFLFNLTSILFFFDVYMIIKLSLSAVNPNRIKDLSNKLKHEIEDTYKNAKTIDNNGASYGKFMVKFNMLNELMAKYSHELEGNKITTLEANSLKKNKRLYNISDLAEILYIHEIISKDDIELIDMFRKYRNAIAHGTEMEINENIFESLEKYYSLFEGIYQVRDDVDNRRAAYSKLRNEIFE